MNIPYEFKQISVSIYKQRLISALKKMSGTRLSVIDPLCEAK